jgi:hypothetical protein
MDMRFNRQRYLGEGGARSAAINYPVLVATLQAMQLATPTARAGRRGFAAPVAEAGPPSPLAAILLGSGDWQQAVVAQGGSFNPCFARPSAAE